MVQLFDENFGGSIVSNTIMHESLTNKKYEIYKKVYRQKILILKIDINNYICTFSGLFFSAYHTD